MTLTNITCSGICGFALPAKQLLRGGCALFALVFVLGITIPGKVYADGDETARLEQLVKDTDAQNKAELEASLAGGSVRDSKGQVVTPVADALEKRLAAMGAKPDDVPALQIDSIKTEAVDLVELSLNSVVMFALDGNPDVGMAESRVVQAEHNKNRAVAAYYPQVDLTVQQAYEYNNPAAGSPTGKSETNPSDRIALVLEQLIYDGGVTSNVIKQREEAKAIADLDVELNTQDVLGQTVREYLNVLRLQKTLGDTQSFMTELNKIVGVINMTYELGGSAKSNVDYAQSRLASAESNMESTRAALNDALSNLEFLTGPLPTFIATAPDDLDPERLRLDDYVKLAQDNNTDLQMNESDLEMMKYKLKSDKGVYMPAVSMVVSGEKTYDDGGYSGRDLNGKALVQMSYNIFDGFETRENVKRTQAMITEIEIRQEKILKDLRKQLKLSYNQLVSLKNTISKTKAEIASSESLQNLNRQNFEQGNINLIELIEGEERLNAARARLHQQEADVYLSAYKLLIDVGILKKAFFCNEC